MAALRLTEAIGDQLAASVAQGIPLETAAQAAGIGARTVYDWLQTATTNEWRPGQPLSDQAQLLVSRFSQQIASAQAQWEAAQVSAIVEDAEAHNSKTGLRDWRARAWLLNNHPRTRARYRQEHVSQVTTTGTVHHEHALAEQQDDDTLRSWLAALPTPADQG